MTAPAPTRIDVELVRRGLAPSRTRAAALVSSGRVELGGVPVRRAADRAPAGALLVVRPAPGGAPDLVSRAGHKLRAALATFDLLVAGRRCLDAGASTGGFTDVLLRAGAAHVAAVDVGHDQLDRGLRADRRVTAYERTNVRDLQPADIGGAVELTVADLSFISLRLALPALARCTTGDLVLLVKPQFEVGRVRLGSDGVIREQALRADALAGVADVALAVGLRIRGAIPSPLPGHQGNVELLLALCVGGPPGRTRGQALEQAGFR